MIKSVVSLEFILFLMTLKTETSLIQWEIEDLFFCEIF